PETWSRGDEITVCIVLAPPYSRGRDLIASARASITPRCPSMSDPPTSGASTMLTKSWGRSTAHWTEDPDTEAEDLVVDLLDPLRARGDRLGRVNTSLVGVTLYRTRAGGKRRSAHPRALRGEAVAAVP
ncbi:MAG: hypothetical protein ABSG91_25460, partial [Syntrophobacteraceae bacterium]